MESISFSYLTFIRSDRGDQLLGGGGGGGGDGLLHDRATQFR